MSDSPDLKRLVNDMEPVLCSIGQGIECVQFMLRYMEDRDDDGKLHFILDALETRYAELRQQWESVHGAVCRPGPRLVGQGGES